MHMIVWYSPWSIKDALIMLWFDHPLHIHHQINDVKNKILVFIKILTEHLEHVLDPVLFSDVV